MKRLIYILFTLFVVLSCTNESVLEQQVDKEGLVTVKFKVDVPEPTNINSRAVNENYIYSLHLLVFDENGLFISRHSATLAGSIYTVSLPQSSNKRIIHFIANYDWTGFNDTSYVGKDEREIIPPLTSTNLLFWQRVVLNSGLSSSALASQPVSMIRNMAKFSLTNLASSGLVNAQFALFNGASAGSAAPFNTQNQTFESVVTEPANVVFNQSSTFGVGNIYTFERKNSTVTTDPTYIIIQGSYAGVLGYYKIDIIDENKNIYDINRNVWYNITVESVTAAGYSTLAAAQSSPAANNITASVLLQSYPTISDGMNVLSVNKTTISFTSNNQTLNANATYKTVAGVSLNSQIVVTLIQDPAAPVVNGTVGYDPITGNITAAINNVPANGANYNATIKIEAGVLSRTIKLMLHSPFVFSNLSFTPSVVPNVSESSTVLKFTIPNEADYLLPLNCYITSAYLTPEFGNIEVVSVNGVYKYKWKATSTGVQTVNFKTNTTNSAETVYVEADLFQRAQVNYTNASNVNRFSNVVFTPNPVAFGVGQPVTLKFTVPTTGLYKIYTSNLNPVGGTISGGIYNYTATSAGEQIVNFLTNKQNSAETVRLSATNYLDYSIPLKNPLINISGKLNFKNSNTVISNGTVTVLVGTKVLAIFNTSSTGTYQTAIEAGIGDVLTFSYTASNVTYKATQSITGVTMTINKVLQ